MSKKLIRYLIIFVAVVVLFFLLYKLTRNLVISRLDKALEEKPLAGHLVTYDDATLAFIPPGLNIKGLKVTPDSTSSRFSDPDSSLLWNSYRTEKFNLKISGVNIIRLLTRDLLAIGSVMADSPKIYVYVAEGRNSAGKEKEASESGKKGLKGIEIDEVGIRNGKIRYIGRNGEGLEMNIDGINLTVRDLVSEKERDPKVSVQNVSFSASGSGMVLPGHMYSLNTGYVMLSTREGSFLVDSLVLKPLYDKKEFARRAGYQTDRMDISIRKLTGQGILFDSLMSDSSLVMASLIIEDLQALLYRDKNIPRDPENHPLLPHNALAEFGLPVLIDSVLVNGGSLTYEELPPDHDIAGKISLSRIAFTVKNVTNILKEDKEEKMIVRAHGMLMDQSLLHVDMEFPVSSEPSGFHFSGHLEPLELPVLNSISEPNMGIRINSGFCDYVYFNSDAGLNASSGRLRIHYENIHLTLLKKYTGNGKDKNIFTRFGSAVTNGFIHKKNPKKGEERIGMMHFERDHQKSFLNYMIKTLLSGVFAILTPGHNRVVIEKVEKEKKDQ